MLLTDEEIREETDCEDMTALQAVAKAQLKKDFEYFISLIDEKSGYVNIRRYEIIRKLEALLKEIE